MGRKLLYSVCVLLSFGGYLLSAQDRFHDSYNSFRLSAGEEYASFADSVNVVFVRTLREQWALFYMEDGIKRPEYVKPQEQPVIRQDPVRQRGEIPSSRNSGNAAGYASTSFFPHISSLKHSAVRKVTFSFYETDMAVQVPYSYGLFHPGGVSESDVAAFWEKLASYNYDRVLDGCRYYVNVCGMNDWAVQEWTQALAAVLFPGNVFSEQAVFSVFLMNQMGYNVRLARIGRELVSLFSSGQQIYSRKFISVDSCRYYVTGNVPEGDEVYTYRGVFCDKTAPLDLHVRNPVSFGRSGSYHLITRHSKVLKKDLCVPVSRSLIDFYDHYPQVDVEVYASAATDIRFEKALAEFLRPFLSGRKSTLETVNLLLEFLQKDFRYMIDMEQFGHEKPFFCEESFFYEFCDCEDRVTLLAHLLKGYLGLDVILMDYGDHIAAGVRLPGMVRGDYVVWNSEKYYVCDPTCIGAVAGMSMTAYSSRKVRVSAVQNGCSEMTK